MKLRDDLAGVVYVGGVAYTAGADLPEGAAVSATLLAADVEPEKPKRGRPAKDA